MVSLWPWKDANSPAEFEKALASLAEKIANSQAQLDFLRQRGRRAKVLWTLYSVFAYLLCAVVLVLVVGWKNWSAVEYTGISASPLVIYLVRQAINAFYTWRIDTVTQRLEDRQLERTQTIDKLKAATKYNSTQELIEKYGGITPAPKPRKQRAPSLKKLKPAQNQPQRTVSGPPPLTANVPRPGQNQVPTPVQRPSTANNVPFNNNQEAEFLSSPNAQSQAGPPEFAPNAYAARPQYAQAAERTPEGKWYDRVLDLLLGDDETNPKNRIVLICQNCRRVNGQAPPGTKSPAELGKWRCFGCGGWNGEEDEAAKVVQEIKERIEQEDQPESSTDEGQNSAGSDGENDAADEKTTSDEIMDTESAEDIVEVKATKGRAKTNRKKA
ncbi:hypothetical protein HYFRA_00001957 [Hymenoscyphus fraxineus]|uniref:Endoplasmic reticulum junction formation protein lunapark n=1 Tax=Hymenoscyphus fraxineus TaxID=746836 RepID=A0A9N9KKD2_9HELO|nr:hypothetical protein HYFRA_00001957 [Hymenoscyphus fraxineus]